MPKRVFQGHITLIRAERGAAREEDVGRDYGISKVIFFIIIFHRRVGVGDWALTKS